MAVTVRPITLWRRELQDRPGALADSLAPLTEAAVDVQILMAYRFPGEPDRAAVELFPVTGKRATAAAEKPSPSSCASTLAVPSGTMPTAGVSPPRPASPLTTSLIVPSPPATAITL